MVLTPDIILAFIAALLLVIVLALPVTRLLLGAVVFVFVILAGLFTIAAFLIPL
jgi:hypothetical protein